MKVYFTLNIRLLTATGYDERVAFRELFGCTNKENSKWPRQRNTAQHDLMLSKCALHGCHQISMIRKT